MKHEFTESEIVAVGLMLKILAGKYEPQLPKPDWRGFEFFSRINSGSIKRIVCLGKLVTDLQHGIVSKMFEFFVGDFKVARIEVRAQMNLTPEPGEKRYSTWVPASIQYLRNIPNEKPKDVYEWEHLLVRPANRFAIRYAGMNDNVVQVLQNPVGE